MNDSARQKLIEIVARHGRSIVDDPQRAEGLFRDNFGSFKREIAVLTMALEEGVTRDMASATQNAPTSVLLARLTQRLIDNLALSEDAARWAVDSWALALGVVQGGDLKTPATQNTEKAQTNIVPATVQSQTANKQRNSNGALVVSADNTGDFTSISEAINAAANGAQILVRPGLYEESLTINKQIEIVGDGAVRDIIVRSRNESCLSMQADRAAVRNLTLQCAAGKSGEQVFGVDIQSGELTLQDCEITSDSLACIAVRGENTNPSIQNCRIGNGADGGIYFFDSAGGTVDRCEILRNRNASVIIAQRADPHFKKCHIGEGENVGIWVYEDGLGTIDDCDIFGHRAGGVIASNGNPVLRGCKIHNSNESGIFVQRNGSVILEECSIYENQDAGISIVGRSIVAASNCQINRNGTVAVRAKEESTVRVENSDLTGNESASWETEKGVFVENKNNRED
ncbi:MAG: pectinesterase family protein [Acidobacteriota bacterium]|nr:pectinesterase family protein [Acidobacteriota bacterium]